MELEELMQASVQHLESGFYGKPFKFSYSSLNKLLWNPAVFYQLYVMGLKEEKTESYLVQGKIIHALLLEEHKFEEQFIISPSNLPTGNLRVVLDRVFSHHRDLANHGDQRTELAEFSNAILDVMRDMNYFQNLKTDQQRIDKILTNDATIYWSFLKLKGDKTLIDQESFDFCKSATDLIKVDPKICGLLHCNPTDFDNKEVLNEEYMECDLQGKPFGLKGFLDNVVIDHDQKIIFINDIKTTSKDLKDFKETIEFYGYWMQAAIYFYLVVTKYADLLKAGYQTRFHFIVIDRAFQTYPFNVSNQTMTEWTNRLQETIEKAEWHYNNNDFTLPYEFATGTVVL